MGMGWKPIFEVINLSNGDWIYSRTSPTTLPSGTTAQIVWANGVTWDAVVDGNTVTWRVEAASVALVPSGTAYSMFVRYPNTTTGTTDDYEWKNGRSFRRP
jgi:hypothetical protein